MFVKSKFSSGPSKDYDRIETSLGFQVFIPENLIACKRKTLISMVYLIKSCLVTRILEFLYDIISGMEFLCANGDPLMFQQMQNGLLPKIIRRFLIVSSCHV